MGRGGGCSPDESVDVWLLHRLLMMSYVPPECTSCDRPIQLAGHLLPDTQQLGLVRNLRHLSQWRSNELKRSVMNEQRRQL
jgi:hypothetical protein